jgi:FAD-linked sulfhydryl oxidase
MKKINMTPQRFPNDPKIWGPHAWIFIHTIASQYPERPTQQEKQRYKMFFVNLPWVLPCVQCGINMMNYIEQNYTSFNKAFESRQALFDWTVGFHNHVNSQERTIIYNQNHPKRTIL